MYYHNLLIFDFEWEAAEKNQLEWLTKGKTLAKKIVKVLMMMTFVSRYLLCLSFSAIDQGFHHQDL
jgi:hypothetical protein